MKKHQSGFTLVEIAIVLVIIGLLLGGVLKGQSMIESAKVKALANEMKAVQAAYYAYEDKFKAIPGDDAKSTTHLGATVNGVAIVDPTPATAGDSLINTGTWVGAAVPVATNENALFWMHTRAAGLMTGDAGSGVAVNSAGGALGIGSTAIVTGLSGSTFVCTGGIDGKLALQLDTAMDDGKPNGGAIQATAGTAIVAAAAAATSYAAGTAYTVCMGI